jgi:hypothetical protein
MLAQTYPKGNRMKKVTFLLPIIICFLVLDGIEHEIKLESPVIKIADGSFINADKIEFMRKFRRTLLTLILGEESSNGQRKGDGLQALAHMEQELDQLPATPATNAKKIALEEELTRLKAFFIVHSHEFMESGRGAKNILIVLIQEDCEKRNRPESLLLEWAKTKEGHETTMFEQRINSFHDYYHFCTDLVNFLLDLIHSCPKAENQFKDRVSKWGAVKKILPILIKKAHVKTENFNEIEFLKYLKERYLDKITLEEITPQTIVPLLIEYIKHTTHG